MEGVQNLFEKTSKRLDEKVQAKEIIIIIKDEEKRKG